MDSSEKTGEVRSELQNDASKNCWELWGQDLNTLNHTWSLPDYFDCSASGHGLTLNEMTVTHKHDM